MERRSVGAAILAGIALLASQATAQVPTVRASGNIAQVFGEDDYPPDAWLAREEGLVRFALDVAPDGRVTGCSILVSSGSRALDEGTCRIAEARGRLTPARDAQGRAVADRLTASIRWQLPDELPLDPMLPDLADYLTMADYPAEALEGGEQGQVDFTVIVSPRGRPTDCTVTRSSGSRLLDQATCRAMMQRARFAPARDAHRRPIRGGVSASVLWRIEEGGVGSVSAPPALQLRARAQANLASYVHDQDYPDIALRRGEQGRVVFVLHISPEGRVTECSVVASNAGILLNARTCDIMRTRARFEPARDLQGNPAPDRVHASISWRM